MQRSTTLLAAMGFSVCAFVQTEIPVFASMGTTETVTLVASQDTSIFEGSANSNGSGNGLYIGMSTLTRRSLLAFDLSSIPAGSTIVSATLNLSSARQGPVQPASFDMTLHRVTQEWGEAGSGGQLPAGSGTLALAGDATWFDAMFPGTAWATQGGDFIATPSATDFVIPAANAEFSEAGMVSDVQGWLDGTIDNYGWIVRADESTPRSARAFASREFATASRRPQLTIEYMPAPMNLCSADFDNDGDVDLGDFGVFGAAFGSMVGDANYDAQADLDADGDVDLGDFGLFGSQFGNGPAECTP